MSPKTNVGCISQDKLNSKFTSILNTVTIKQAPIKRCDYELFIDRYVKQVLTIYEKANPNMSEQTRSLLYDYLKKYIEKRIPEDIYDHMPYEEKKNSCTMVTPPPIINTYDYTFNSCYTIAKNENKKNNNTAKFMTLARKDNNIACYYSTDKFDYSKDRQMCTSDNDKQLYTVSNKCSDNSGFDDCLEEANEKIINDANKKYAAEIKEYKDKIKNNKIMLMEYEKGNNINIPDISNKNTDDNQISFSDAKKAYEAEIAEKKEAKLREQMEERKKLLEKNLKYVKKFYLQTTDLVGDKNRLIATKNSNINNQYDEITSMDKKISTITQDIYLNQKKSKDAEGITSILRVLVIVFIVMGIIFVIYFFNKRSGKNNNENRFNNFINNINNKLNNRFKL